MNCKQYVGQATACNLRVKEKTDVAGFSDRFFDEIKSLFLWFGFLF